MWFIIAPKMWWMVHSNAGINLFNLHSTRHFNKLIWLQLSRFLFLSCCYKLQLLNGQQNIPILLLFLFFYLIAMHNETQIQFSFFNCIMLAVQSTWESILTFNECRDKFKFAKKEAKSWDGQQMFKVTNNDEWCLALLEY